MDIWCRRSAVVAAHAAVSSDQPIATSIGIDILKMGGNAADAAIATMAAVSVIQPMTCGIGGDCQCLFYRKAENKLFSINGSGRTGENAALKEIEMAGIISTIQQEFSDHGLWVSVPGTVAGMYSVIKNFGSGKLTMNQILEPAIKLAEEGVPVPYKTAVIWDKYKYKLKNSKQVDDLLNKGESPLPGEKLFAKKLALSFKMIASHGVNEFYCGKIAENIVKEVQNAGGMLTVDDMKNHLLYKSTHDPSDAVFVDFHGLRVWEMKPNTIGIVVLVALNILKMYDLKSLSHNSAEYIHIVAEVTKYSYLKCWNYLCDPDYNPACFQSLLSENSGKEMKMKFDAEKASGSDYFITGGNTSYVAVVDKEGNGCSFICSVSSDFGTGLIPSDCGFVLHDRLKSMSLDKNSPNAYGPKKRPLHSIIPSMITDIETNELLAVLGVCGRWMQPQGQIQVLLNMVIFGMDPQVALNQPRFYVGNSKLLTDYKESLSLLSLEYGISASVEPFLQKKGHRVTHSIKCSASSVFGRGHVIARPAVWNRSATVTQNSWWAGADPRTDGCAMGF